MSISTGNRLRAIPLLILLTGIPLLAQEQEFFNQHQQNPMLYNPAFAGERMIPGFTFHSRQQLLGWEGTPSSNQLMAHTRLKNKNAGAGASLAFDRMGPVYHTGITGIYSYALQIRENSKLIMGLQGEIRLLQVRLSRLQLVDQGDQLFAEDPGLKAQPNAGLGVVFHSGDYRVSLSMPRLLNSALSPFEGETSRWSRTGRVVYLGATSSYDLNEEIQVEPAILIALTRGFSPFIELAATAYYHERFGMGMLYRFNKTLGAKVSYKHKEMFIVGYAYDVSLGLIRYNAGTHELFLGYNFPFNRTKTVSPRRF